MKVKCDNCNWNGFSHEFLVTPNPFDLSENIYACPQCKEIRNTCVTVCEYGDCEEEATKGQATERGYRLFCSYHG